MTRKVGDIIIIEEQEPATCEMCGKIEELRPYGPGGKNVCFDCAMKDPVEAERQYTKFLMGKPQYDA